mmetsp:Transcript_62078/g.71160  ORF Transcript_62078/g.71160 Transcript_62078/m.71160 type:complete len:359 (-) Transcript_62078:195-1271(-)
MKVAFTIAILATAMMLTMAIDPTPQKIPIPEFQVDLDVDPAHRWDDIVEKFYDYNKELVFTQMNHVIPSLASLASKWINPWALDHLGDSGAEIKGLARKIKEVWPNTVVNESSLMMLNFLYALDAGCTSTVAQTKDSGVLHGRNMDFGFTTGLRLLSINVTFTKSGKPLYKGTTFLGYTGLITGMRYGGFSISLNARHADDSLAGNVARIALGYKPPTWLARETLETVDNYDGAHKMMADTKIASSIYMIMSGPEDGQGTVLTRKPSGLVDDWPLDMTKNDWFRLETNYDHWNPPPSYDDRRTLGYKHMEEIGQDKLTKQTFLDDLFSQAPTMRPWTVYTIIMSVRESTYDGYIWWYY